MVKLIQEYFSASAEKFPDKIAVNWKDQNITFAELESRSNQLAFALKGLGVKRGDRIAFCLQKSPKAIQVILGILKVDAAYVPLNPRAPEARIAQMINDAQPSVVICERATKALVKSGKVFDLDEKAEMLADMPVSAMHCKNTSVDLAYILYTSGSTGIPKGVMITHGNIINATDWAVEEFGISEKDRMSQHPPLHFDLSTFDLYCAFKAGATLYLVPEELSLFPGQLLKFIEESKLTIWNSVPSVLVYLWNSGLIKEDRLSLVRKFFFNGEGFPTRFLAEWMKTFPKKEFVNMYGPTETTVQCTFYRIPEAPTDLTKLVPIGKACRNVEVFLVDGELCVAGDGVGLGYWNNPEKTAVSFVDITGKGRVYKTGDSGRLLPDGNYEFIGRKDFQVKIMGNRIELGDVEAALLALPYIEDAAAVAIDASATGGQELIGFVKLKEAKEELMIKIDLAKLIPQYMVPAKIVVRPLLPRTSTGKVDRNALKSDYGDKK
ncbi:MAG: amino acid adenylation domain-containing protein [bacterium]|nr:amino acid adenylation domain-containing protein [bacterium]